MTRQEALDYVKNSGDRFFRYGDLSFLTSKDSAIEDIQAMEEIAWNDGEIFFNPVFDFGEETGGAL